MPGPGAHFTEGHTKALQEDGPAHTPPPRPGGQGPPAGGTNHPQA